MIVRPDWCRRKYLFSAVVIAAAVVFLVSAGNEAGAVRYTASGAAKSVRTADASREALAAENGVTVFAYDPWRPYDAPVTVGQGATRRTP